jgi:hypothetical protein
MTKSLVVSRLMTMLLVLAYLVAVSIAVAQSGGGYDLAWWTVDGGGSAAEGGGYRLVGTAGQPDAQVVSGGGYSMAGGLWVGGEGVYQIYLPIVLRNAT